MKYQIIQQSSIKEPLVSIITPTFNVESYIEEQLNSLLNQILKPIELVIVDDGSTDKTLEILKKYAEIHSEITLVSQLNSGPSRARNVGLELFRGEFVYFVDSDDVVPINALYELYDASTKYGADITTGRSLSFNSTSTWYIGSHFNKGLFQPGEKSITTNPELVYSLGPASKLYKASIVKDLRMPETIKIGEDQPFVLEALLRSKKIYTIDQVVYNYRSRENEEISLSQIVKINPYNTFSDIVKSLFIGLSLFPKYIENQFEREDVAKAYFDRVIRFDLWPSIREVLKLGDVNTQIKVFKELIELTSQLPNNFLSTDIFYFQMLTIELLERYTMIKKEARPNYIQMLSHLFHKIGPGALGILYDNTRLEDSTRQMIALEKTVKKESTRPIFNYLATRRVKRIIDNFKKILMKKCKTLINVMQSFILRKVLFQVYKFSLPKNKILFMTNKDEQLAGSFKPVYDEIQNKKLNNYEVICYFKATKRNFDAQKRLLKDVASAKYIFLDDYYRQIYGLKMAKETQVIQLWHAAGAFKKFGFGAIGSLESNTPKFEKNAHQSYTNVICSSSEIVPYYAEAFDIEPSKVLPLGIPRTDKLLNHEYCSFIKSKFHSRYPIIDGRKVVTYAPTFRGSPKERQSFKMMLHIRKFVEEFSNEYILVVKMHPSVSRSQGIPYDLKNHVLNLSKMDMNDLLICTDVLITDYSSVIFDYSLLERPMIFYAYDLEEYMSERDFYYNYENFVPGPIVKSNTDLFNKLRSIDEFESESVINFRNRFFDNLDGKSANRIVNTIIK